MIVDGVAGHSAAAAQIFDGDCRAHHHLRRSLTGIVGHSAAAAQRGLFDGDCRAQRSSQPRRSLTGIVRASQQAAAQMGSKAQQSAAQI